MRIQRLFLGALHADASSQNTFAAAARPGACSHRFLRSYRMNTSAADASHRYMVRPTDACGGSRMTRYPGRLLIYCRWAMPLPPQPLPTSDCPQTSVWSYIREIVSSATRGARQPKAHRWTREKTKTETADRVSDSASVNRSIGR